MYKKSLILCLNDKREGKLTTTCGSSFHKKVQFTKKEYIKAFIHDPLQSKGRL